MSRDWFQVDKEGLAQIQGRRDKSFALLELIANTWDELGVTTVDVTLYSVEGARGLAILRVEDDAPDGFANLTDAYTLFAASKKKGEAEVRGRFNLGEKLVLSLCTDAEIISTRGSVLFDENGRHAGRRKRERGSSFEATIRLTRAEVAKCEIAVHTLIPPPTITTTYNGVALEPRNFIHSFAAKLPTEIADDEDYLRPTERTTNVYVYEPLDGETPSIYELGIPVVDTGDRWHIDIAQKVPLNTERDNVRPAYLRRVRTLVLNEMNSRLEEEDARQTWVRDALSDKDVTDEAVERTLTLLYGDKRVAYDPSDRDSNLIAVSKGYQVISGGAFNKAQWENVRRAGAAQAAGQVTPSPKVIMSLDGKPPIPRDEWTPQMIKLAEYARELSQALLGFPPHVQFWDIPKADWCASWGKRGRLGFNIGTLGQAWIARLDQQEVDALLLHEFAHEAIPAHLAAGFGDEVARLGAKLRNVRVRL